MSTPQHSNPLAPIEAAIERAREILSWSDDFDGEGSVAYREATWRRARDLLLQAADQYVHHRHETPPAPFIWAGPDGSIDLHWEIDGRELLLNVPVPLDEPPSYYGDTKAGAKVKGIIDERASNEWLLTWLTQ